MTRPDRESRFDDVDITALTIVELEDYLSRIVDRHVIIPDPYLARSYELRIAEVQAHVQREVAIRNRRETERQDALAALPAGDLTERELDDLLAGRVAWKLALGQMVAEIRRHRAARTASVERVRAVVREAALHISNPTLVDHATANAIADRVAAQLTASAAQHVNAELATIGPLMTQAEAEELQAERAVERDGAEQPDPRLAELESELAASEEQRDVYRDQAQRLAAQITEIEIRSAARCDAWLPDGKKCGRPGEMDGRIGWRCVEHWRNPDQRPMPYRLGPEDLDALTELAVHAEMVDWPRAREALDKILAAHRCPEPTAAPLPEVIRCGTEGCVSSIKKSYLPSGWLLHEGTWRCPRCKVIATSEAS